LLPPSGCKTILASERVLSANGTPQRLVIRVGQNGKPIPGATVVLTGPGINAGGNTGSTGLFRTAVSPRTPGVLTVDLRGSRACKVRRIGILASSAAESGPSAPSAPSFTG
jgi:hypothetical protein